MRGDWTIISTEWQVFVEVILTVIFVRTLVRVVEGTEGTGPSPMVRGRMKIFPNNKEGLVCIPSSEAP